MGRDNGELPTEGFGLNADGGDFDDWGEAGVFFQESWGELGDAGRTRDIGGGTDGRAAPWVRILGEFDLDWIQPTQGTPC